MFRVNSLDTNIIHLYLSQKNHLFIIIIILHNKSVWYGFHLISENFSKSWRKTKFSEFSDSARVFKFNPILSIYGQVKIFCDIFALFYSINVFKKIIYDVWQCYMYDVCSTLCINNNLSTGVIWQFILVYDLHNKNTWPYVFHIVATYIGVQHRYKTVCTYRYRIP